MLDDDQSVTPQSPAESPAAPASEGPASESTAGAAPAKKAAKRTTSRKKADPAPDPATESAADSAGEQDAKTAAKKASAAKKTASKAPSKSAAKKPAAKRTTKKVAAPEAATDEVPTTDQAQPEGDAEVAGEAAKPAKKAAAKKATTTKTAAAKKTAAKKAAGDKPAKKTAKKAAAADEDAPASSDEPESGAGTMVLFQTPDTTAAPARRTRKTAAKKTASSEQAPADDDTATETGETPDAEAGAGSAKGSSRRSTAKKAAAAPADDEQDGSAPDESDGSDEQDDDTSGDGGPRRRRRRGGRRRRKSGDSGDQGGDNGSDQSDDTSDTKSDGKSDGKTDGKSDGGGQQGQKGGQQGRKDDDADDQSGEGGSSRRRRRRRRAGEDGGDNSDDPENTVTRVRQGRSAEDQITAVSGSTRLEAKKQRRREGREAGRRRAPIVSEAEFLARRESVDRVMVIRQRDELTQIGVLEDKVLVEHYVARESQTSLIGNVYLGRVQNVLPSMEAAFIDIGKGRNAVLYAGEVNWQALGHKDGQPRKIESVLSSGQPVLVQVTKDPVGHKGARLTSQISLAGRFLVYVPDGTTSGISRKLPDTERNRLKTLLKEIVPDTAGVIVRTAAEGASEDELTRDVERLKARWEDIEKKAKGNAPQLLYGEPDLTLKVVRDLFTEDFSRLVIEGDDAWETVQNYVAHVAPDLEERLERYDAAESGKDVFAAHRIDEQIAKALDRKVWLPSGGSLIIDRTEAMTVVDVNTGKFTGSGGNLEETVTKNNLEAAEEVVRQLRLRDIGGIIVVDFIDMVLESNRDLVLRRLVECLGRDRTRHQVAEVTSLGLVQMTRKRIGTGLLEAFSENCEHCQGRGLMVHDMPIEPKKGDDDSRRSGGSRRSRGGRGRGGDDQQDSSKQDQGKQGSDKQDQGKQGSGKQGSGKQGGAQGEGKPPSPKDVAAMARPEDKTDDKTDDKAGDAAALQTGSLPADTPVEDRPSQPERAATEAPVEKAPDTEPEAAPEPPAAPEKPKVVTRTRRRSASRPAGPPSESSEPATTTLSSAPVGTGQVGSPAESGVVEPGTAESEPGPVVPATPPPPVVEHVPIKKRGRKR